MKIVLALANTPFFTATEREVLQRIVTELGRVLLEKEIRCVACITAATQIEFSRAVEVHVGTSTKKMVEPGDIVVTQYSTLIHDLRDLKNRIVLLNNKATSFMLTFPWVINHEMQVRGVIDDVMASGSPMQSIWSVLHDEEKISMQLTEAKPTGRVLWALKALLDRAR